MVLCRIRRHQEFTLFLISHLCLFLSAFVCPLYSMFYFNKFAVGATDSSWFLKKTNTHCACCFYSTISCFIPSPFLSETNLLFHHVWTDSVFQLCYCLFFPVRAITKWIRTGKPISAADFALVLAASQKLAIVETELMCNSFDRTHAVICCCWQATPGRASAARRWHTTNNFKPRQVDW